MCGISGIYSCPTANSWVGDELKNKILKTSKVMVRFQKARGPDSTDIKCIGSNLSFGHNRLSIVDLKARSNQPMVFGSFTIVYNGEIYNFKDIKRMLVKEHMAKFKTDGDTEVILQGIHYLGIKKLINLLNGIFSIAIHDSKNNKIYLVRDRLGIKPLYYYIDNGLFLFASTPGAIAKSMYEVVGKTWRLDKEALEEYFSLGCIYTDKSFFKNIKKMMPAEIMTLNLDGKLNFNIEKYWNPKIKNISIEETSFLIEDSVKKRMLSDVPIQVLLSGGLDSTLVASILKVDCLNIKNRESDYAQFAAKKLKRKLTTIDFKNNNQMKGQVVRYIRASGDLSRSCVLPTFACQSMNQNGYKVGISGNGSDELFFGYKRTLRDIGKIKNGNFLNTQIKEMDNQIFRIFRSPNSFLIPGIKPLSRLDFSKRLINRFKFDSDRLNEIAFTRWLEVNTMVSDLNTTLDFAGMSNSVEMRVPYLDYRLVEAALNLEAKDISEKRLLKKLLKEKGFDSNFIDRYKLGFSSAKLKTYNKGVGGTSLKRLGKQYGLISIKKGLKGRDLFYLEVSANYIIFWLRDWVDTGIVRI